MKPCATVLAVLLTVSVVFAQQPRASLSSKVATVTLIATVPSSVSVVPETTQATFDFTTKTSAQTAFGVTVNWSLSPSAAKSVQLYAYFDNALSALGDANGHAIGANHIDAAYGAGNFNRFPISSEPLLLYTQAVTRESRTGSVTNPLNLRLSLPPDQAPGHYQGVLHLRAQTF